MRHVPQSMLDAWLEGDFTGGRRPMARVTLQTLHIASASIDSIRLFTSAMFGDGELPVELPNIKSIEWDRSLGSDIASCTLVLYNTMPLPLGDTPAGSDFDLPGSYTFNYGATSWSSRWGQTANKWQSLLQPDMLIRTYEGYGFDASKRPEDDPYLVQTGLWMIDDIEFGTDGLITVTCRDVGRLLNDQIMFPPVIPLQFYPLVWEPKHQVKNPDIITTTGGIFKPTYSNDSGYSGHYVGRNATIAGHRPSDAFDKNLKTYWLSIGNAKPSDGYSYEWIEGACGGKTVSAVAFKTFGGPYRVYLSLKVKGKWQGTKKIPYDPDNPVSAPNGADITYSAVLTAAREAYSTFTLPSPVPGVEAIRLTFTDLFNSGIGPYRYRAGVRDIYCSSQKTTTKPGGTHTEGNYGDYSEIVKYLLACGGFYWPKDAWYKRSDGHKVTYAPAKDDPFLTKGRVWGDIMMSGTTAYYDESVDPPIVNKLDADVWDKKPLLDGIKYVQEILGFVFYIDETGGAVFRLPNIYQLGNYIGSNAADSGYRTLAEMPDVITTIDERQTLIGLHAKISSANIREYVFVANANGQFGATSAGFNPLIAKDGSRIRTGMRRVGGWTDENFRDQEEAQRMADMITMAQAFTYRTDQLTISANPAIQIDDQIRIYERISSEGYYHYVKSIKSTMDLEQGKWTYDLTTNWLGEQPFDRWVFNPADMASITQTFLQAVLARIPRQAFLSGGGHLTGAGAKRS